MRDVRIALYLSIALHFARKICTRCIGTKCNCRHYGHVVYGDSSKPIRMPPDSVMMQMMLDGLQCEINREISNYLEKCNQCSTMK